MTKGRSRPFGASLPLWWSTRTIKGDPGSPVTAPPQYCPQTTGQNRPLESLPDWAGLGRYEALVWVELLRGVLWFRGSTSDLAPCDGAAHIWYVARSLCQVHGRRCRLSRDLVRIDRPRKLDSRRDAEAIKGYGSGTEKSPRKW